MKRLCRGATERGATFVEFALILPLFFIFLFGIADVTRYFTTKILLTHAAISGLSSAKALQELEYDPYLDSEALELRQAAARFFVAEESLKYPRAVLPWVASLGKPLEFQRVRTAGRTGIDDVISFEALLLLPGESAAILEFQEDPEAAPDANGERPKKEVVIGWRDHPFLCSEVSSTCINPRQSSKVQSEHHMIALLRSYPMIVEIAVEFHFLTPGFSSRTIVGRAAGYRERMPKIQE